MINQTHPWDKKVRPTKWVEDQPKFLMIPISYRRGYNGILQDTLNRRSLM